MYLSTLNLNLRPVDMEDADEVARMWEYEKGRITPDEAKEAIEYMQRNHKSNDAGKFHHLCLAVFEKGSDKIIGWAGLDANNTEEKIWIFYMIDKECRGKGYATQCAAQLLDYAFNELGLPYVNGGCDKQNLASYCVMKKVGMIQNAFEANGDPLFYIDCDQYRELITKNSP